MENKYYTPKIEEFCVGFEYETIYLKSVWTKDYLCISDCGWFFESYHNDASPLEFRVKYLDKEDIESLGFVFIKYIESTLLNSNGDLYSNNDLNLSLVHYPTLNKITIVTKDPSLNEILVKGNWDDKQINLITVKNKTELKKILKMLN